MSNLEIEAYNQILILELQPALGCTEPIALAYATALAKKYLAAFPKRVNVLVSGNIVKNVKSVTIPNSGGMSGLGPSVLLGLVGGNSDLELEVLSELTDKDIKAVKDMLGENFYSIDVADGEEGLYIEIKMSTEANSVHLIVKKDHLNVVYLKKNQEVLIDKQATSEEETNNPRKKLSFDGIMDYIEHPFSEGVKETLKRQIQYNSVIAKEGLEKDYGVGVGRLISNNSQNDSHKKVVAAAAAGADARMGGSLNPVVINSGSGNQGITVSMPVIEFANQMGVAKEKLYKALALSNLLSVRIKYGMGNLSAFCGAVSAAAGSGAAITYLSGGDKKQIANTIVNTLGNLAGVICDGAKASCAVKVASSVEGALLGHKLAMQKKTFNSGEGLILDDIEKTIDHYAKLGLIGMKETDRVILEMMTEEV